MDTDPWETGSIATEVESKISNISPEEAPQVLINEEHVVMVDLDLSQGVISSTNPENGATFEDPTLFDTKESPSDINEDMIPQESHSEKEVEETEMMEPKSSLEPLSTEELDYGFEEPTIVISPSPMLTSTSKEQEP